MIGVAAFGCTWDKTDSKGTALRSLRLCAAVDWVACILMALYTARSITHSLQGELARTVAALGAEYNSASSPKPLQMSTQVLIKVCQKVLISLRACMWHEAMCMHPDGPWPHSLANP